MQIHELDGVASLTGDESMAIDDGSVTSKSALSTLAGYILNTYSRVMYDSASRTVVSALSAIRTAITTLQNKTSTLETAVYYKTNDTETIGTPQKRVLEAGFVTSLGSTIYFDVIVPKLTSNVTNVTATTLIGRLRGVQGPLSNMTEDVDFKTSGYSVSAVIAGSNRVAITIGADTAFTNVVNNSPISFHGRMVLSFT